MPRKFQLESLCAVFAHPNGGELHEVIERATAEGRLVTVDWREETASIVDGVDKLLAQLEVEGLDWSFHDHLIDLGQGEVLRNNNFLCHVRDQLRDIGLHLVHLRRFDDAYRFFIASQAQFKVLDGMEKKNVVQISDDFDGDQYYSVGKVHLKAIGFTQAVNQADRSKLQSKQRKRRIQSLLALLDQEAGLLDEEEPDSLVPPYARFDVPASLDSERDAWLACLNMRLHASWAIRRASRRVLSGEQGLGHVFVDCWDLTLLSQKCLERAYLSSLLRYPNIDDLVGNVSFYEAGNYWDLTIAATAYYCFGWDAEWRECAAFYPLFERRFELSGACVPEMEKMQWALIKFLQEEADGEARLNRLSETAPFGALFSTWENDQHFAQALDELCEWHLQQCHAALRGDSQVHASGYDLFPTWILAIDRNRARTLGRTCLPDNELLGIAGKYIAVGFGERRSGLAEKVRHLYDNTFGAKPVDLLAVWDAYLQQVQD